MEGAFDLFEQGADIVEAQPRPEPPQVARLHHEADLRARWRRGGEAAPQGVVDHRAKCLAGTARLRFELGGHVIVEGQGCPHIVML